MNFLLGIFHSLLFAYIIFSSPTCSSPLSPLVPTSLPSLTDSSSHLVVCPPSPSSSLPLACGLLHTCAAINSTHTCTNIAHLSLYQALSPPSSLPSLVLYHMLGSTFYQHVLHTLLSTHLFAGIESSPSAPGLFDLSYYVWQPVSSSWAPFDPHHTYAIVTTLQAFQQIQEINTHASYHTVINKQSSHASQLLALQHPLSHPSRYDLLSSVSCPAHQDRVDSNTCECEAGYTRNCGDCINYGNCDDCTNSTCIVCPRGSTKLLVGDHACQCEGNFYRLVADLQGQYKPFRCVDVTGYSFDQGYESGDLSYLLNNRSGCIRLPTSCLGIDYLWQNETDTTLDTNPYLHPWESQLFVLPGFWWSGNTSNIFKCPSFQLPHTCKGTEYNTNPCATGYTGKLCLTCVPNYGSITYGQCFECYSVAVSWMLFFLSVILQIFIIAFVVRQSFQPLTLVSCIIKIGVNFLQMSSYIFSMRMADGHLIKNLGSILSMFSSGNPRSFSFRCAFILSAPILITISSVIMLIILIVVAAAVISVTSWEDVAKSCRRCCHRHLQRQRTESTTTAAAPASSPFGSLDTNDSPSPPLSTNLNSPGRPLSNSVAPASPFMSKFNGITTERKFVSPFDTSRQTAVNLAQLNPSQVAAFKSMPNPMSVAALNSNTPSSTPTVVSILPSPILNEPPQTRASSASMQDVISPYTSSRLSNATKAPNVTSKVYQKLGARFSIKQGVVDARGKSLSYNWQYRALPICLVIVCFMYPAWLEENLHFMRDCWDVEGRFMIADSSTDCDGPTFEAAVVVAWIRMVLVSIGLPIAVAVLLYANLDNITTPVFFQRYRFLFEGYKEQAWYYESIVIVRKMFIVLISVLLDYNEEVQFFCTLFLFTISILLHCIVQPYDLPALNQLEMYSLCTLILMSVSNGASYADIKWRENREKELYASISLERTNQTYGPLYDSVLAISSSWYSKLLQVCCLVILIWFIVLVLYRLKSQIVAFVRDTLMPFASIVYHFCCCLFNQVEENTPPPQHESSKTEMLALSPLHQLHEQPDVDESQLQNSLI